MAPPLESGNSGQLSGLNDLAGAYKPQDHDHPTAATGSGLFITESEFLHDNSKGGGKKARPQSGYPAVGGSRPALVSARNAKSHFALGALNSNQSGPLLKNQLNRITSEEITGGPGLYRIPINQQSAESKNFHGQPMVSDRGDHSERVGGMM